MTSLRRRLLAITVSAAVVAAGLSAVLVTSSQAATTITDVSASITMPDGVVLAAEVAAPTSTGLHPLIVMPSSWGSTSIEYHALEVPLAQAGYVVVGYANRGMGNSTGVADFADPSTVSDVTSVINWAIAHKSADPTRIAAMGISYGAGISLLAAEHDTRIKAVAALSTWSDFNELVEPAGSLAISALGTLAANTKGTNPAVRIGPQMSALFADAATNPAAAAPLVRTMATSRSAVNGVAVLNSNHTAVLMANGMQDSLLPPLELVTMFGKLTGPKRLELRTGDHAMPEAPGLYGGSTAGPIADAFAWIDHFVRGINNGADTAPAVSLTDTITGAVRTYAHWPGGATSLTTQLGLPGVSSGVNIGAGSQDWSRTVLEAYLTSAESPYEQGDVLDPYRLTTVDTSTFSDPYSFIWNGAPSVKSVAFSGSPTMTLTESAPSTAVSFAAYIYDVAPSGTGTLMTEAPMTIAKNTPNTPTSVTLRFQPIAWTVAAGHHLSIVIDYVDHRWAIATPSHTLLTLSSSGASPSTVTLPTS